MLTSSTRRPTWVDAVSFSLSWHRTDLEQVLIGHRWRRGVAVIAAIGTLAASESAVLLHLAHVRLMALILGALIGFLAGSLVMGLLSVVVEMLGWMSAPWRTWRHHDGMAAGAYVCKHKGEWTVCGVHARPQGQGLGHHLMTDATAWADNHRYPLHLRATDQDAARFYQRYGFTPTATGRLTMARQPSIATNDSVLS